MAFFRNNIRKGVMKVINDRVKQAQVAHDKECDDLDAQCEAQKEAAEYQRDLSKRMSAERHITSIIGKLL